MYDIVLLTEGQYVERLADEAYDMPGWYIDQIFEEDRIVAEALERRGLKVGRVDWADESMDWRTTRAALFRATWDYFHRFPEFKAWLQRVEPLTQLINPAGIIYWNFDKFYLRELMAAGVRVAPTEFLERGDPRSLGELFSTTGWTEAVVKPAVSGGARETYRVTATSADQLEAHFSTLIVQERMLFQKFLPAISGDQIGQGEVSIMAMGGVVTHAIRKVAAPGDFRVQDDHGGRVLPHDASADELEFAKLVIGACREAAPGSAAEDAAGGALEAPQPLYHRIDMVRNPDGQLTLCELELIEPELWLRTCPEAADKLASAIVKACHFDTIEP